MAERLIVGDTVTITNTFAVSGTATDPTTVTLVVTDPAGTATTSTYAGGTVTKSSTGVYTKNITATATGLWAYKWTGTGPAADVQDGTFEVVAVAPGTADTLDVLTLLEGRAAVGISATDTGDDTALAMKITAVSRRLDQLVGPIVVRTITNEVQPGGSDSIMVNHWPVSSYTTVTEYDSAVAQVLTAEDFDTQPDYGYSAGRWHTASATYDGNLYRRASGWTVAFPTGPEAVKLTYVAGRYASTTSVDPLFKEAASVMLSNAWRPRESAVQMVGEFDVPAQNFPRFGVPNYVRDLLHDEWIDGPKIG